MDDRIIITPSNADIAIRRLIEKYHGYGAEVIVNALVRATADELYLDPDAISRMFTYAYKREEKRRNDVARHTR